MTPAVFLIEQVFQRILNPTPLTVWPLPNVPPQRQASGGNQEHEQDEGKGHSRFS